MASRMRAFVLVLAAAVGAARPAAAQFQARPTEGFVMPLADGRMAVLTPRDGGIVITGLVAAEQASPGPEVDLRTGDRVVRFQQRERPALGDVSRAWDAIPDSAEVAVGVERGGTTLTVRFRKPRARTTPGSRMAIMTPDGGTGGWVTGGGGSSATEVVVAGNHIRENDQGMPHVAFRASHPGAAAVPLRTGDVITHFNGRTLAALRGFEMFYERAAAGEEIVLTVQRGGGTETVRFRKPAS